MEFGSESVSGHGRAETDAKYHAQGTNFGGESISNWVIGTCIATRKASIAIFALGYATDSLFRQSRATIGQGDATPNLFGMGQTKVLQALD